MLSIGAMASGQGEYYLHLAQEDYYLEGGEPPGKWLGLGARALGMEGVVGRDALRNLLRGFSADGSRGLVQNAGKERHQPGWDLTFSVPKSVSVLWSQADGATRKQIQEAQAAAIEAALAYLESSAAFSRRGRGGLARDAAGLVVAAFEHGTSRAVDPQLHTHCLVLNVGIRPDGTTGTILSKPLYQHKMTAGALYRAELAYQLEQRLGVVCKRTRSWFEIAGVPRRLMEEFSKRRAEIEAELRAAGMETASAAAFATLITRKPKELVAPRQELFQQWRSIGAAFGFTRHEVDAILRRGTRHDLAGELREASQEALTNAMSAQSCFSERDLIRRFAEAAQGRGLAASAVCEQAYHDLRHLPDIVALRTADGEQRYTTREILRLEANLLKIAESLKADTSHQVRASTLQRMINKNAKLNSEQRAAVAHATRNPGRVQVISGMAGTGKTYMLGVCRKAWEKDGFRVVGAALSGKAARELEKGSGIMSDTLAKRLWDLDNRSPKDRLKHDAKQLFRAARGKHTYPFNRFKIDSRTIMVLDEAGMVDTRQMGEIMRAVERGGGKLVLVGDAKQLQAIEAGGAFAALGQRLGQAQLTQIIRQEDEWVRQSIHELARGESAVALRRFAEHGLLTVSRSRDEAMRSLVSDWKRTGLAQPQNCLIFVGTNLEAVKVNRLCQAARLERDGAFLRKRIKVGTEKIYSGDRILCTKKSRLFGVENGDTGTVVRIGLSDRTMTVKLDRKSTVTLPIREYDHLRLGYAVTTHKGQGATVDRAFVLVGGSMQDREISYVQASRARHETRLYTDESEAGEELRNLVRQMQQSRAKILAHDVGEQQAVDATRRPTRSR